MKVSVLALGAALGICAHVQALDTSTIEKVLKEFGDMPCRLELLALGVSFVNAHGCATSSSSFDDLDRCRDKVFDFLETGGQVLKKEKCVEPLSKIINKKIVDIDLKPLFRVFTDLYDCTQDNKDISVCRDQAVPALLRIGSQFANELLEGVSPELEKLAVSALESEQVLGRCLGDAPLLKSTLSAGDYAEYESNARAMINAFNYFGSAPLKRLLDDKQEWAVDRVLELLEDQTPLSLNMREWDAAQIKDMRKCAQEWSTYSGQMTRLLQSPDVRAVHMRVFERLPFLNALRPWYQAFFDNVDYFVTDVFAKGDCMFTWRQPGDLNQCVANLGAKLQAYVEKLRASETYELKQDYKAGWTEDHAILSQRPIASQPAKRPGAPANEPGDAFSDSPSGSGHGFLRFVWHTIVYFGVVAAVVGAAVYARKANVMARLRGFRPIPSHPDALDAEAQCLLREAEDDDMDSDDEMINL